MSTEGLLYSSTQVYFAKANFTTENHNFTHLKFSAREEITHFQINFIF